MHERPKGVRANRYPARIHCWIVSPLFATMRKGRFVLNDVDPAIYEQGKKDGSLIFNHFESQELAIPTWATTIFIYVRLDQPKIDISFFEDVKDFFLWYSKVLIAIAGKITNYCFQYDDTLKEWRPFDPPTLIGVNLRTKLR